MKKNKGNSFLPPSNNPFKNLTRRDFVRASAILAGAGALSTFNGLPVFAKANMDELMEMFKSANIDWKQASGTELVVGGLQHPWFEKHSPFLDSFTELTGITVKQEIQSDTEYVTEVPVKLGGGSTTPDVYMVWALGQSVAAGWLEPLDGYYNDPNLTDLGWYNLDDVFNSAKAFPVWSADNVTYAMSVTAEAETLFTNKTMLIKVVFLFQQQCQNYMMLQLL
jgi:multiple sugar transport system substrate-binding protein